MSPRITSQRRAPSPRTRQKNTSPSPTVAARLLDWYDQHRRQLPWRYNPGEAADPYRVWLSEIMLQQTVVKAVIPYFEAFTTRWPTVDALAAAPLDDVLTAWAGLGYYSRARNLHAAARAIVADHKGQFPRDETALRALPGVGPYTAAAIVAIAFGDKATPVDGNVERVVARLAALEEPLPQAKRELRERAAALTPDRRAGDFAQAMMDLGATVCTPRSPACPSCPLRDSCRAYAKGIADTLPRKAAKAARPVRFGTAFVIVSRDGHVLLRKRPSEGLLGGLFDLPSTDWSPSPPGGNTIAAARPLAATFEATGETVVHVFTHFRLELQVERAQVKARNDLAPLVWAPLEKLDVFALPTLARKTLAAARVSATNKSGKSRISR